MTIKHLVISGGGPIMIQIMSAIQELERKGYLNTKNIESIYGTSAGAIIGVLLSLDFDWDTLNDYIIKRPWKDVFPIKIENILEAYTKKGIFDIKTVEKCINQNRITYVFI
jgi:predicted acylesterase/phospholipase RssA